MVDMPQGTSNTPTSNTPTGNTPTGNTPSLDDLDRPTCRVRVERCVCFDQPFSKLLALAQAEGLTQDELSERTGCCTGCGMCKPYVRVVLSTGRTSIPLMNGRALRAIAEEAEGKAKVENPAADA